jgi:hypothetical protein
MQFGKSWLAVVAALALAVACGKKEAPAAAPTAPAAAVQADKPAELPSPATSTVCPGTANALGVGKPCDKQENCRGQLAIDCPRSRDPKGFDFCTRACTGADPAECGDGATCVPRGTGGSLCVPNACSAALAQPLATDVQVNIDCASGATELGVGKVCASHADCQDTKAAHFCPRVVGPKQPGYCSMLCKEDGDCGGGAFCWRRKAEEHGKEIVVASCAPLACRVAAAVAPTPTTAP